MPKLSKKGIYAGMNRFLLAIKSKEYRLTHEGVKRGVGYTVRCVLALSMRALPMLVTVGLINLPA